MLKTTSGAVMREIEIYALDNAEDEQEFQVPTDELAAVLGLSEDELVDAIESDEVEYREMGAEDGQLVVELEVLGKSCRLRILSRG